MSEQSVSLLSFDRVLGVLGVFLLLYLPVGTHDHQHSITRQFFFGIRKRLLSIR